MIRKQGDIVIDDSNTESHGNVYKVGKIYYSKIDPNRVLMYALELTPMKVCSGGMMGKQSRYKA
jgi:hypothetical protein